LTTLGFIPVVIQAISFDMALISNLSGIAIGYIQTVGVKPPKPN